MSTLRKHVLVIEEFTFKPSNLTILSGDTVEFFKASMEVSNMTLSCEGEFDALVVDNSSLIGSRTKEIAHTFRNDGVYTITSEIYNFMQCTVKVIKSSSYEIETLTVPKLKSSESFVTNPPRLVGSFATFRTESPSHVSPTSKAIENSSLRTISTSPPSCNGIRKPSVAPLFGSFSTNQIVASETLNGKDKAAIGFSNEDPTNAECKDEILSSDENANDTEKANNLSRKQKKRMKSRMKYRSKKKTADSSINPISIDNGLIMVDSNESLPTANAIVGDSVIVTNIEGATVLSVPPSPTSVCASHGRPRLSAGTEKEVLCMMLAASADWTIDFESDIEDSTKLNLDSTNQPVQIATAVLESSSQGHEASIVNSSDIVDSECCEVTATYLEEVNCSEVEILTALPVDTNPSSFFSSPHTQIQTRPSELYSQEGMAIFDTSLEETRAVVPLVVDADLSIAPMEDTVTKKKRHKKKKKPAASIISTTENILQTAINFEDSEDQIFVKESVNPVSAIDCHLQPSEISGRSLPGDQSIISPVVPSSLSVPSFCLNEGAIYDQNIIVGISPVDLSEGTTYSNAITKTVDSSEEAANNNAITKTVDFSEEATNSISITETVDSSEEAVNSNAIRKTVADVSHLSKVDVNSSGTQLLRSALFGQRAFSQPNLIHLPVTHASDPPHEDSTPLVESGEQRIAVATDERRIQSSENMEGPFDGKNQENDLEEMQKLRETVNNLEDFFYTRKTICQFFFPPIFSCNLLLLMHIRLGIIAVGS